jgi:hypothetical protein
MRVLFLRKRGAVSVMVKKTSWVITYANRPCDVVYSEPVMRMLVTAHDPVKVERVVTEWSVRTFTELSRTEVPLDSLRTKKETPNVWIFACTSGDAYDITQTDDRVKDGDVLIVPSEGIVGVMVEAWPTAMTSENGQFHKLSSVFLHASPVSDSPTYTKSFVLAAAYVRSKPYQTAEKGRMVWKQLIRMNEEVLAEKHNVLI